MCHASRTKLARSSVIVIFEEQMHLRMTTQDIPCVMWCPSRCIHPCDNVACELPADGWTLCAFQGFVIDALWIWISPSLIMMRSAAGFLTTTCRQRFSLFRACTNSSSASSSKRYSHWASLPRISAVAIWSVLLYASLVVVNAYIQLVHRANGSTLYIHNARLSN